jgi:protein-S-isoprenylcysteine O-methyltransferase Ste14
MAGDVPVGWQLTVETKVLVTTNAQIQTDAYKGIKARRPAWMTSVAQRRLGASKVIVGLAFLFLLTCYPRWPEAGLVELALNLTGLVLIALAVLGRIWSSLYISGYKNKSLVTLGPYSVVRNPLYFFSFLGAVGIAAASGMFTFVLAGGMLFACYYYWVIRAEEWKLRQFHGADYEAYYRRVPRFIPRFSLLNEPEYYQFNSRLFRRAVFNGTLFLWAYFLLKVAGYLHASGWFPVLLRLY